jgi:hypothetical protein
MADGTVHCSQCACRIRTLIAKVQHESS